MIILKIIDFKIHSFWLVLIIFIFLSCADRGCTPKSDNLLNRKVRVVVTDIERVARITEYIGNRLKERDYSLFNKEKVLLFGFPEEKMRAPSNVLFNVNNWEPIEIYIIGEYADIPILGEIIVKPKNELLEYFHTEFVFGFTESTSQIAHIPPKDIDNLKYILGFYSKEASLKERHIKIKEQYGDIYPY